MNGWIRIHKNLLDSDVWDMPPLYNRVWLYLLLWGRNNPGEISTKKGKLYLERGQLVTSIQQICEGVVFYEWGVPKVPNKKTVLNILQWLEQRKMIIRESNAKGTIITIVNWAAYQPDPQEKVTQINGEGNADKRSQELDNTDTSVGSDTPKSNADKRSVYTIKEVKEDINNNNHDVQHVSTEEEKTWEILADIINFPERTPEREKKIRGYIKEWPEVDPVKLAEVFSTHVLDKPFEKNGTPLSKFRRFFVNAEKYSPEARRTTEHPKRATETTLTRKPLPIAVQRQMSIDESDREYARYEKEKREKKERKQEEERKREEERNIDEEFGYEEGE